LVKSNGKQHKRSLKTLKLTEAKGKLRDYRVESEQASPRAGKTTVSDACKKYLKTIEQARIAHYSAYLGS
jgi:hypothetical protein